MTFGVRIWYSGEEFSIDFLLLLMCLYIFQVLPVFLSNDLPWKKQPFLYQVICTVIFYRHNLYFLFLQLTYKYVVFVFNID